MDILFTQYLLPSGVQQPVKIDRPDDIAALANSITFTKKHRFECEMLTTGEISFTCFDIDNEEDIAIEVCQNGPSAMDAVDKMITSAHKVLFSASPAADRDAQLAEWKQKCTISGEMMFAPSDGMCWSCGGDLVKNYLETGLVWKTCCPLCNRSFVE